MAVAAVAATTGVAVAVTAPSNDTPAASTAAGSTITNANVPAVSHDSAESDAAIRKWWTPARMQAALRNGAPAPRGTTGLKGAEIQVTPAEAGAMPVETTGSKAQRVTNYDTIYGRTTGKIFFTMNGKEFVCSGAVVTAKNRSTVWTAGHCVKDAGGAWASRLLFRPRYKNGATRGTWTARKFWTSQAWSSNGNLSYDFAAVVLRKNGSATVQGRVGALKIRFGSGFRTSVRSHGYPEQNSTGGRMNGQVQWFCSGTSWAWKYKGVNNRAMNCTMGPGSSGGPWIHKFANGWNIIGNVSHGIRLSNGRRFVQSPQLGAGAKNVWNAARNT